VTDLNICAANVTDWCGASVQVFRQIETLFESQVIKKSLIFHAGTVLKF
jgi:hypothetical protein